MILPLHLQRVDELTHLPLLDYRYCYKCTFKHVRRIKFMGTSYEIALKWMLQAIFDDKSTYIQWIPP